MLKPSFKNKYIYDQMHMFVFGNLMLIFEGPVKVKEIVKDIILQNVRVSSKSLEAIIDIVEYVEYDNSELFIAEGKRDSREYFVIEGVCRSFLLNPEGEEITISFFTDQSVLSPFTTRTYNGLSNVNYQALTALKMGVMDAGAFEKLMVENLEIREFGNIVLRNELKQKVEKEIGMASLTAKERLKKFRENYPLLENTIPHTAISSYLGITTISLSRLRKELMK